MKLDEEVEVVITVVTISKGRITASGVAFAKEAGKILTAVVASEAEVRIIEEVVGKWAWQAEGKDLSLLAVLVVGMV